MSNQAVVEAIDVPVLNEHYCYLCKRWETESDQDKIGVCNDITNKSSKRTDLPIPIAYIKSRDENAKLVTSFDFQCERIDLKEIISREDYTKLNHWRLIIAVG